jgi:hypothetical protein
VIGDLGRYTPVYLPVQAAAGKGNRGKIKVCPAKVGPAKVGPAKVCPVKVGLAKVGPAKGGPAKVGIAKVGPEKSGIAKVGLAKVGLAKVGPAKVGPAKVGPAKVGLRPAIVFRPQLMIDKDFCKDFFVHTLTSNKKGNRLWSLSGEVFGHLKAIPSFALPEQGFGLLAQKLSQKS